MENQINATTEAKTYNGWTNYETWVVQLWLDNDEAMVELQHELLEQARSLSYPRRSKVWTSAEATRFTLADLLADFVEGNIVGLAAPLNVEGNNVEGNNPYANNINSSLYTDLLGSAIGRVNFIEIADHIVDKFGGQYLGQLLGMVSELADR